MPPRTKIQKEDIIETAYQLVRQEGMEGINARAIAKQMNTSIQPIFHKFSNMEELKQEVIEKIIQEYRKYIVKGSTEEKAYKAMGLAYIHFAKEEPKLFKILFMSEQKMKPIAFMTQGIEYEKVAECIATTTGFSKEKIKEFHLKIWIFTHGLASLIATGTCEFSEEEINHMLKEIYTALYEQEKERGK